MKKVLIVTIHDNFNLGNRLQNYALQYALIKNGVEVSSLYRTYKIPFISKIKNIIKDICVYLNIFRDRFYGDYKSRKEKKTPLYQARFSKFEKFTEKYITNKIYINNFIINEKDFSKFDMAITGSDQVWHNWSNTKDELDYYFLKFMPKEKRMSYAPSFGFSEFPETYKEVYREGLMGMNKLSCREEDGCKIIKELTGRDAELVLDPTLLLTSDEWLSIAKKPSFYNRKPYILIYFLGTMSEDIKSMIKKIQKENNFGVIDVLDKSNPEHYKTDPQEFVYLVSNAECVITDSFHGTVFSTIFERNFIVCKRQGLCDKMFSRLDSLLSMLKLTDRIYDGEAIEYKIKDKDSRYKIAKVELENMKEKSMRYIDEMINSEEN